MSEERSFRKSAFGGFNRKDVIQYIEQLMNQLEQERAENRRKDERILDLERKLEQYEAACAAATIITIKTIIITIASTALIMFKVSSVFRLFFTSPLTTYRYWSEREPTIQQLTTGIQLSQAFLMPRRLAMVYIPIPCST